MIQSACLLILVVAVTLRARRSYRKPAWWATVFGLVSLATYGVIGAPPSVLDGFLGDRNLLTLVRDASGLAAMWAFHNAVATERGFERRRLPWWSVAAAIAAFAIPFLLITDPGHNSPRFVLDRLDQPAVWLFATLYTAFMGIVSALTIRMLAERRTAPTVFWVAGLSLMVVSDVLEVLYLCVAHFGPVSASFREHYYYVSELPFFSGIFLAVAGFIWILGARTFWWAAARWTVSVDARGRERNYRENRLALARAMGWSNRQLAFDSAANIRDRVKVGLQDLSAGERVAFAVVERTLSKKLKEVAA
ncbi:hypothetical protein [Curtobacterium flaccumfaciens]|uniref:hypothetical protein n=1 Tax=Curtobacterium flaccumfaciens TaxID=2035 RepID=UPI001E51AD9E|nr:hypothetical protein [Curtobacterium allii]MCE0459442.1 hypothetical protein [Curtobacterium allii]